MFVGRMIIPRLHGRHFAIPNVFRDVVTIGPLSAANQVIAVQSPIRAGGTLTRHAPGQEYDGILGLGTLFSAGQCSNVVLVLCCACDSSIITNIL